MHNDSLLIDAHSIDWIETVQKLHSFLSDRAPAERKPGSQKQSSAEESTRSDNNLTRAWSTALAAIIRSIDSEANTVDFSSFEKEITWA